MACVDVPALPLQLLIYRHAGWADQPAVVLDHDKPQGLVLWANERARKCGVLPGMKYAAGLALANDLRGAEISETEIVESVASITELLRRFTPEVEPSREHPGVFWLNASGLQPLFAALEDWGHGVRRHLRKSRFYCRVVVGFTRFGTYALAKAGVKANVKAGLKETLDAGVRVLKDVATEQHAARQVPLRLLDIDPELRDVLDKLGIRTVGAFINLPRAGIRRRFGPEAHSLHRYAAGDLSLPLQPQPADEPLIRHVDLEPPETDIHRLLFVIKHSLDSLLATLAARQEALTAIEVRLRLETGVAEPRKECAEEICTAAPTLDIRQILNLVHLRFEGLVLPSGVTEIDLLVTAAKATREQLRLFRQQSDRVHRNLAAANRAVARIRAEFGERTVVQASLTEGHLPEAKFAWQPLKRVVRPSNWGQVQRLASVRPLVRRLFARPRRLPGEIGDRHQFRSLEKELEKDSSPKLVPVTNFSQMHGPHVISGGWWRALVHREYYFAHTSFSQTQSRARSDPAYSEQTPGDRWSWIYYDRRRRRWFLHGEVE